MLVIFGGVQFNWFCVFGLEVVNIVVQKVCLGWDDLVLVGGVELMSWVLMGFDGGVMGLDLVINYDVMFVLQSIGVDLIVIIEGFFCEDVDVYVLCSQ